MGVPLDNVVLNVIKSDYKVLPDHPLTWQLGLCDLERIEEQCVRTSCINGHRNPFQDLSLRLSWCTMH